MRLPKQTWIYVLGLAFLSLGLVLGLYPNLGGARQDLSGSPPPAPGYRPHLDHSAFFHDSLSTGQDVTRACLECHEDAAEEMLPTAHFQWVGDEVVDPRSGEATRIGKRNLLNNFCIAIGGNEASCTRCHAGYGYEDDGFDFTDPHNIDCLVCHDRSGGYLKGSAGNPREGVDLLAAAKSVGYPKRENCGVCHFYGGGGLGVKHGDLDNSLRSPGAEDDVHMGRGGLLCIDCHGGDGHNIRGKAYSVSVNHDNGIGCTDCHAPAPHRDARLDGHTARVACQTCHIPAYATKVPTKTNWDWSRAGDDSRPDDTHHYLKIKGEFIYEQDITPEYYWFDLTVGRYLIGDSLAADGPTPINWPNGGRHTPGARIWPFKVHRGKQPADAIHRYIIPPITSGEGGYWREFDWDQAIRLGAERAGLAYSGQYDFAETEMFWPLSHLVQPKERSLQCAACHGEGGRLDWQTLGYDGDPMRNVTPPMETADAGGGR